MRGGGGKSESCYRDGRREGWTHRRACQEVNGETISLVVHEHNQVLQISREKSRSVQVQVYIYIYTPFWKDTTHHTSLTDRACSNI